MVELLQVEHADIPDTGSVPLVADMSSNILSRQVDVSKFGVILAGAQKNIGCSGLTIVIVRDDLLESTLPVCPTMLKYLFALSFWCAMWVYVSDSCRYSTLAKAGSMYNTPPTWSIYISYLVFGWMEANGGVPAFQALADKKSALV